MKVIVTVVRAASLCFPETKDMKINTGPCREADNLFDSQNKDKR